MNAAAAQSPAPSPAASVTASPAPTPSASGSAQARARVTAEPASRTVIVTCKGAPFYAWPDRTVVPSGTSYPPARMGDAFGVIGGEMLTNNGMNLTETTIDVVQPFGAGKHYWIASECIT